MTNILDHITSMVKEMTWTELQHTVLRLAEQNEHVRSALHQVWKVKEREARLAKSIEWTPDDWFKAQKHFEPIIQDEFNQCAALFEDRYERSYRGYHDYSDEGRWDYTAGLEQLERWFAELLEMAADGEWIDASVGMLLTLQRLDDWAQENGDEDMGGEDLQDECVSFWPKSEELIKIIRDSSAPISNKSAFFLELIDWIVGLCEEEEDWAAWRQTLGYCLFGGEHYERLKNYVTRFEPNLFRDTAAAEAIEPEVIRWWVQISLESDREAEAERAEAMLNAFDADTSACFVRYYERFHRLDEAITRLQFITGQMQEQLQRQSSEPFRAIRFHYVSEQQVNHYFEWLVAIYEQAERQAEAISCRVHWFETLPSLELFQVCLNETPPEERDRQAKKWMAHVASLKRRGFETLLIDMHLHIGELDRAWSVYQERRLDTSDRLSDSVRRLFEAVKKHDPIRLLPVLRQFAEKRIAEKSRSSYQHAAAWLTELKSIYLLLNQTEEWTLYLQEVREEHRRLPALQDEITKAKL